MYQEEQLRHISKQFQIYGEILHAELCKIGHINETYTATYDQGGTRVRYVHQKINQNVFKNPGQVMDNFVRVTSHIREKLESVHERGEITRRVLTIVPTRDGKSFYVDGDGNFWRTFVFVERVKTYETVETPKQAYQAARAFGEFQKLLVDLPGRLHETIPDFHNTRKRFKALEAAIDKDRYNRAQNAAAEIKFAQANEKVCDVILKLLASGRIPERITHNDTKFNNVMLDVDTGEAMCVVDLDTVMPGCALYDFGDMVRTTTSPTLEDELDLSKVNMRMSMFKELARGYLDATGSFLTKSERSHIAFAGRLITFTIGIRFLTDYLSGDTYFRVHRPNHNLDRARTQFKLVESISRQEDWMQKFVDGL